MLLFLDGPGLLSCARGILYAGISVHYCFVSFQVYTQAFSEYCVRDQCTILFRMGQVYTTVFLDYCSTPQNALLRHVR